MRVLITGARGQLGYALQRVAPAGMDLVLTTREELDLASPSVIDDVRSIAPQLIINAAAYTAVDRAETDIEAAMLVNRDAVAALAEAAQSLSARLLHISTDFVFDGSASRAYVPDALTAPLGVYGSSKRAGEVAILERTGCDACIVRTAWVYETHGANFVKTMLRLMAERDRLSVVADQIGTPTWATGLARVLWCLAVQPQLPALLHWTDQGVASWYDFAVAIQEEACHLGLLAGAIPIDPITTDLYPTPAARPAFSLLDKRETLGLLGDRIEPLHWRVALRQMLSALSVQTGEYRS